MALKNIVGIVGSKDCLPHHRHGLAGHGGDEFPRDYPRRWLMATRGAALLQGRAPQWLWRSLRRTASALLGAGTPPREQVVQRDYGKFFPSGSWYGNDTIWRTVDDLNRILITGLASGRRSPTSRSGAASPSSTASSRWRETVR